MLYQDMEMPETPFWSYFCQISDSTTSYGSYSELSEWKNWGKLDIKTPKFIIESDADCSTSYFCLFIRSIEYTYEKSNCWLRKIPMKF
jgi:hypothetical protein